MNTVLHNSLAAIDRIFDVFDLTPEVADRPDARPLAEVRGRISFERVSFGYRPGEPVLHEIDIDVFIDKLAAGDDTLIGERGAKLSGGQKQRLALYRAQRIGTRASDPALTPISVDAARLTLEGLGPDSGLQIGSSSRRGVG